MKMITLAVVSLFAAVAVHAEVVTKGGAAALADSPDVRKGTPATAMSCKMCKSEFVTVTKPNFKGSAATTAATVERHACTACGTHWTTLGHGKSKVELAAHTCGACVK